MNQQQHDRLRGQFPALAQEVNGHPLVYLDNAATTQKPQAVLDAINHYYRADNANVHRAAHALSDRATRAFEDARETVARFINAPRSHEVIWTRGTTEAINLVANGLGLSIEPGDEIIVSEMEHHSNIVPWHLLRERRGAVLKWIPILDDGSGLRDCHWSARYGHDGYILRAFEKARIADDGTATAGILGNDQHLIGGRILDHASLLLSSAERWAISCPSARTRPSRSTALSRVVCLTNARIDIPALRAASRTTASSSSEKSTFNAGITISYHRFGTNTVPCCGTVVVPVSLRLSEAEHQAFREADP